MIAALLLLALGFAGYWIVNYLKTGGAPWSALPYFGTAAAIIVVIGFVAGFFEERSSGS